MGCGEGHRKPFKRVIVAGTFDHLHAGHQGLLEIANALGGEILVCLADGPLLLEKNYKEELQSYEVRKERVEAFLRSLSAKYAVTRIEDPVGPAGEDPEAKAIVVSTETYAGALRVNRERGRRGLEGLVIVVGPLVLAEDGKPLKSARIRAGEVDERGRIELR